MSLTEAALCRAGDRTLDVAHCQIEDDLFERRTTDGRIIGFAVLNFSKHTLDRLTLPLRVTALPVGL